MSNQVDVRRYRVCCHWASPNTDAGTYATSVYAASPEAAMREVFAEMTAICAEDGVERQFDEGDLIHCLPDGDAEGMVRAVRKALDGALPPETRALLEQAIRTGEGHLTEHSSF
ncbi:hypothetical protein J2T57_001461 [Natronocella acetinitrilica]|uniref:Uncharacterized protein n=1 Tax=Natronocella acetinitrilica TaxID=414046 RepID=A0AAE3KB44_9GAMM|nr:hypothetical protein [Natronocella acetinitrilica]MCP1674359.1 hypothetical protein [Natronocella acetinitrilica]